MANVPIVTEKTYSEMAALIAAGELNLALSYLITDRGDNGLLFRAAAPNRLENDGLRYMLCPATYATGLDAYDNDWIGVWNATKGVIATEGQLCIWNGLVWVAGATLSGDAPDVTMIDETPVVSGWTVIPKASFTNHEYIEMIFGVTYDFDDDWINKQWDENGNVFGLSKKAYEYWSDEIASVNYLDYCDWNFNNGSNVLYENKCYYLYNNSKDGSIFGNKIEGIIANNSSTGNSGNEYISYNSNVGNIIGNSNSGIILKNKNIGNINNNSNQGSIRMNINNGDISDNTSTLSCNIEYNTNNGSITGVWDSDVTDTIVDKTGTAE